MKYHNYEYILGVDSVGAFIPVTLKYIEGSNEYFSAIANLFENYSIFDRESHGYYIGTILFGYISKYLDIDIYFSLQLYSLFVGSFITNILFLILNKANFGAIKSFKYSLIIYTASPILLYTAIISRDLHVALLYLIAINLTISKSFSFNTLIYLLIVIIVSMTFRVETGLFLFVLIPVYLLITLQNKKQRNYVLFASMFAGIIAIFILTSNFNQIQFVYDANQEAYFDDKEKGSGMISTFQKFPIIGDFASIIYNAVQPLPFWSRFEPSVKDPRIEVYNIMNFPKSISSFFNWFVIVYILFWLFSKSLRKKTKGHISKPLQYNIWIGLFFFYMQSAVIAQRRLIAYYCIIYILFFIIYAHIGENDKKQITFAAILSFVALQFIGAIYLI